MFDSVMIMSFDQWLKESMHVPNLVHDRVWELFRKVKVEHRQFLFRVDELSVGIRILLQSPHQPDFSCLPHLMAECVAREEDFGSVGGRYAFSVRTSPFRRPGGKEKFISDPEGQKAWFMERVHGFNVLKLDCIPERPVRVHKPSGPFDVIPVNFKGILEVTNCSEFLACVDSGIGRKKNYGLGLLIAEKTEE